MNKKIALVHLIEDSVLFSYEEKMFLLGETPNFNERQIDALGKMLVDEQQLLLNHQDDIDRGVKSLIHELLEGRTPNDDQVYVGVGKP